MISRVSPHPPRPRGQSWWIHFHNTTDVLPPEKLSLVDAKVFSGRLTLIIDERFLPCIKQIRGTLTTLDGPTRTVDMCAGSRLEQGSMRVDGTPHCHAFSASAFIPLQIKIETIPRIKKADIFSTGTIQRHHRGLNGFGRLSVNACMNTSTPQHHLNAKIR